MRDIFGPKTPLGKRRTQFADAPEHDLAAIEEAFVEREPVTIVISEKGWVRTLKGHVADLSGLTFKTDDKLDHSFFAESTSKLLLFATQRPLLFARRGQASGRAWSWRADPHVHRHGAGCRDRCRCSSTRASADSWSPAARARALSSRKRIASGNTRKGKQVLNVEMPNEARAITTVVGDTVAVIGTNHKMVLFGLDQVPEMARGRGVRLQKYSSASLSDITVFDSKTGLVWKDSADREHGMSMKELADWRGQPRRRRPSRHRPAEVEQVRAYRGVGRRQTCFWGVIVSAFKAAYNLPRGDLRKSQRSFRRRTDALSFPRPMDA